MTESLKYNKGHPKSVLKNVDIIMNANLDNLDENEEIYQEENYGNTYGSNKQEVKEEASKNNNTAPKKNNIKDSFRNVYIISKKISPDEMLQVRENFEDPSQYLSMNPRIVVGLLPFKSKKEIPNTFEQKPMPPYQRPKSSMSWYRELLYKKLKKHSANCSKKNILNNANNNNNKNEENNFIQNNITRNNNNNIVNISRPLSMNKRPISSMTDYRKYGGNKNSSVNSSIHYDLKSQKELNVIFTESKMREIENKKKTNGTDDLISENAQKNIKEDYTNQEKLLKFHKKERLQSAKLAKGVSKLCNRKETDLLMSKIEDYRLKRQMIDLHEDSKNLYELYGNNLFNFTLRRPEKLDFPRCTYYQVFVNGVERWEKKYEAPYKNVELVLDPQRKANDKFSSLMKVDYFKKELEKKNVNIPNINAINQLKVDCKNAANDEFKKMNQYFEMTKPEAKMRLYNNPYNFYQKNINNRIFGQQYDKPENKLHKCNNISSRTVRKFAI